MKNKVKTFVATVYVGLKEGYEGKQREASDVFPVIQDYVNNVGLCVTVKPVTYIYVNGIESGIEVGLINYPRFPSDESKIREHAENIALMLKDEFKQNRATVVYGDSTVMVGDVD